MCCVVLLFVEPSWLSLCVCLFSLYMLFRHSALNSSRTSGFRAACALLLDSKSGQTVQYCMVCIYEEEEADSLTYKAE